MKKTAKLKFQELKIYLTNLRKINQKFFSNYFHSQKYNSFYL